MSIETQNSYIKGAADYTAKSFQIDSKNDRYITMGGKLVAGALANSAIAVAALVLTVASAAFYTATFLPLYIASQKETIESLANRVKDAKSATQQAGGQITGVWVKEEVQPASQTSTPATKWEQAKGAANNISNRLKAGGNKTLELGNRALVASKPHLQNAQERLSSGLSVAKEAAWNHKGKIAIATGTTGALAAEWYFDYPVSSTAKSLGYSVITHVWHSLFPFVPPKPPEITEENTSTVWNTFNTIYDNFGENLVAAKDLTVGFLSTAKDNAVWLVTEYPKTAISTGVVGTLTTGLYYLIPVALRNIPFPMSA